MILTQQLAILVNIFKLGLKSIELGQALFTNFVIQSEFTIHTTDGKK